jgi:hypothetical protein
MTAAGAYAAARVRLHRPTPAPATTPAPRDSSETVCPSPSAADAPGPPDDSWRLMVLLAAFVVSPLTVVGALWAVTAINTWWALLGALGVYFTTTVVVFATVAFVLSGHPPLPATHGQGGDRSTSARPR